MSYRIPRNTREWLERARETPRVRFSRARRRVLVGANCAVLAVLLFALPAASFATSMGQIQLGALIFLLVAQIYLYLFVSASVGPFAGRRVVLDERERAQRDHATAVAYKLLWAAIIAATVYAVVGTTGRVALPIPSNAGQLMMFLMPIYFLAVGLPIGVLAWTLPDPDPEPVEVSS